VGGVWGGGFLGGWLGVLVCGGVGGGGGGVLVMPVHLPRESRTFSSQNSPSAKERWALEDILRGGRQTTGRTGTREGPFLNNQSVKVSRFSGSPCTYLSFSLVPASVMLQKSNNVQTDPSNHIKKEQKGGEKGEVRWDSILEFIFCHPGRLAPGKIENRRGTWVKLFVYNTPRWGAQRGSIRLSPVYEIEKKTRESSTPRGGVRSARFSENSGYQKKFARKNLLDPHHRLLKQEN